MKVRVNSNNCKKFYISRPMSDVARNSFRNALKVAFKLSLPVLTGYWFLGITYGVLAESMGFSYWYPLSMAVFIFSGSAEFLGLGMLAANFNPLAAACMALVVGARHLFYGVSMLDRYKGMGWRKPFLIFWLTDETFAVNYNAREATATEMLLVSFLDYFYWITGGFMGYMFGSLLKFDIHGLEFVVTAMFTAIFMDQFLKEKELRPAWIGIGCTAVSLFVVGSQYFVIPAMIGILLMLTAFRKKLEPSYFMAETHAVENFAETRAAPVDEKSEEVRK